MLWQVFTSGGDSAVVLKDAIDGLKSPVKLAVGSSGAIGTAVNATTRICSRASAGQILASEVVRQLAAGEGLEFTRRGRVSLKGFAERVTLYVVEWEDRAA